MNKSRLFLVIVLVLGLLVAAFSVTAQDEELTIASSMPSLTFPFFVHMQAEIDDEAEVIGGIELLNTDGQNSVPKQTADVEAAIVQQADGLLISPLDVAAMAPALSQAVEAGVAVVTVDRRVEGVDGILAHVGADNVLGGEAQAQWVLENYPDGATVFHLQGQPGSGPGIDRNQGVHNVLDEVADDYPIVFEQTANFSRDEALSVTEAGLAGLDEPPNVIIAANDDMALGALEAVNGLGLGDQIDVIGFDALPEAILSISEGGMAGTVEQFPGGQARTALNILTDFLRDGTEPESDLVLLTPIVISEANLGDAERISEVEGLDMDMMEEDMEETSEGPGGTIVFIPKSTDVSYWLFVRAGVDDRGSELGYETDYQGVAREVLIAEQADLLRNVAATDPAGIIMAATDAEALAPVVEEIIASGEILVTVDSGVNTDAPYAHFLTDNVAGAAASADALAELIGGEGKVGNLGILAGSQTGAERDQGFIDQMEANYPDVEVLSTQFTGCDPAAALNAATDIITANPDIAGFYSACGPNGLGIAQALRAAGLDGQVPIVTFDPNPELLPLFEDGTVTVMVAQDPYRMGVLGVEAVDALLRGEEVAEPLVQIPVVLITQENYNDPEIQALINLPE
ncbi:MAG: substrate-binding domain-containing protein [Chloroflexota bacterium]